MKKLSDQEIRSFQRRILRFYKLHGRDLPWRRTLDPYKITVAEIMLQQTQVERVIPKYEAWIKRWSTWRALSRATARELLSAWSGLGYNRRALYLGKLAQTVTREFDGVLPADPDALRKLPGIGPYTSKAILIFAFNQPLAAIDTNIRRVLLHELNLPASMPVSELEAVALRVLPKRRSRDWHNALMDFSRVLLPKQIAAIPPLSRQSTFEGSLRQIRGEIIRQLISHKKVSIESVRKASGRSRADIEKAIYALVREGVILVSDQQVRLVE